MDLEQDMEHHDFLILVIFVFLPFPEVYRVPLRLLGIDFSQCLERHAVCVFVIGLEEAIYDLLKTVAVLAVGQMLCELPFRGGIACLQTAAAQQGKPFAALLKLLQKHFALVVPGNHIQQIVYHLFGGFPGGQIADDGHGTVVHLKKFVAKTPLPIVIFLRKCGEVFFCPRFEAIYLCVQIFFIFFCHAYHPPLMKKVAHRVSCAPLFDVT